MLRAGGHLLFGEGLGAEVPVVAAGALVGVAGAAVDRFHRGARGGDHVVAGMPVGGQRHVVGVDGLKPHENAFELVEIAAQDRRVAQERAHDAVRVDEEDGAHGGRGARTGLDHAVTPCHVHGEVGDQREADVEVADALVFDLFADRAQPGDVAGQGADGESEELAAEGVELLLHLAEEHEFGGAYGCEVAGVAEENDPFSFEILRETDVSLCGFGFEFGSFLAQAGHVAGRIFHVFRVSDARFKHDAGLAEPEPRAAQGQTLGRQVARQGRNVRPAVPRGLLAEDEVDGQYEAEEAGRMVPAQRVGLHEEHGEEGEDDERHDLLDHFQLPDRERAAQRGAAEPVGRDLKAVFEECHAPAHQHDGGHAEAFGFRPEGDVSVPGERHEDVRYDQQCDGCQSAEHVTRGFRRGFRFG